MAVSIGPQLVAIIGLALAATVPAITKAQTAAAPTPDIAATIKAVMDDPYGQTYGARHSCWAYSYSDGEADAADSAWVASKAAVPS
ncbi:hypothetical protein C8J98_104322 [Luteibacter sp. OK325]|uniref:hypothetical protein n=1 Tax=Luteibacter sp. OK325 TaxID=2135670 RepID=UPI000D3C3D68|nr:hypothetical protein [Luteibacter sp. OK325]PTR33106.1 hypothetical protein C8J98_104322 [Luteibacter sp. OK325]